MSLSEFCLIGVLFFSFGFACGGLYASRYINSVLGERDNEQ